MGTGVGVPFRLRHRTDLTDANPPTRDVRGDGGSRDGLYGGNRPTEQREIPKRQVFSVVDYG